MGNSARAEYEPTTKSMSTADLLTASETCQRKGFFSRSWTSTKIRPTEMTLAGIKAALVATEAPDGAFGNVAGTEIMQLAQDRGMETDSPRLYDAVLHHASIADLISTVIRKPNDPPWQLAPAIKGWNPDCFISPDGNYLRRVLVVSNWSDERHSSEFRSWHTLGNIAHLKLPMQLVVCIIGQMRDGLRPSSPWASGFQHPTNHQLRFRKKSRSQSEVFSEKWEKIYREDHDEITREDWLEAMLKDDVLREVCFREDIPIPPTPHLQRVRDMASKKLERLYALKETPEANLSGCDWPVACPFRRLCHTLPEKEPEEKYGFIAL